MLEHRESQGIPFMLLKWDGMGARISLYNERNEPRKEPLGRCERIITKFQLHTDIKAQFYY
jgi:hypothetical protein